MSGEVLREMEYKRESFGGKWSTSREVYREMQYMRVSFGVKGQ
jgi:hypothetical protein